MPRKNPPTTRPRPPPRPRPRPPPPPLPPPSPPPLPPPSPLPSLAVRYGPFLVMQDPEDSSTEDSIKQECFNALSTLLADSKVKESFEIINGVISRHPNSAAVHRTGAILHLQLADVFRGFKPETQVTYLEVAAAFAERSLHISPEQMGLIFIYNLILFELAAGREDYEQVANQCEQALLIQDPKKDLIVARVETKNAEGSSTAEESRVPDVKLELKQLMQQAKQALSWEEKGKEKAVEEKKKSEEEEEEEEEDSDFVEILERVVHRRKDQEDARKKLELNVETETDWQKQLYLGSGNVPGLGHPKKANKSAIVSQFDRQTQVVDYWRRMSGKERSRFLVVDVNKLMENYSKNAFASLILSEAINFGKTHQKWKYWKCPYSECTQFLLDYDSWNNHVVRHKSVLLSMMEGMTMPSPVNPVCAKKIENGAWKPVDVNMMLQDNKMDADEEKWPLCKDVDREKLLKKIKELLTLLLMNRCLSQSIVDFLIYSTRHNLETPVSQLFNLISGLNENPLCICFLGSQQLRKMLGWLLETSHCCQLALSSVDGGCNNELNEAEEYIETITFRDDFSSLALDEHLLQAEFELQDDDSFVHWLYMGDEIDQLVKSWAALRAYKMKEVNEALRYLNSELTNLWSLCNVERFWLECESAIVGFENICLAEDRKKLENPGSLLRLYRDELAGVAHADNALDARSIGLSYILNYLKNVNLNCVESSGAEEALAPLDTQVSDLKADEENRQRRTAKAEEYLRTSIREKGFYVSKQKCTADALIMSILEEERKFGLLSAYDYRPIMLHLLKSFVRAHLEEEIADAAKDSLLADLALPPSKSSAKEDCDSRREGKDTKNQERKDRGETKEKTTVGDKQHQPQNEENKEDSFPSSSSDSGEWNENKEEELWGQIDYEEKELELEISLGHQGQLEGEAEQKRLADPPQHSQVATSSSYTIHTSSIDVPVASKPTDGPNVPQSPKHPKGTTHFGSCSCEVSFPTEACPISGETDVTNEGEQPDLSRLEKDISSTCLASDYELGNQELDDAREGSGGSGETDVTNEGEGLSRLEKDISSTCLASDYELGNQELDDTRDGSGGANVLNEEDEATLESSAEIALPETDTFHTFLASDYESRNLEEHETTLESSGEIAFPETDTFHTFLASDYESRNLEEDETTSESSGEIILPEIDIFHEFHASDYESRNLEEDETTSESSGEIILPEIDIFHEFHASD